MEKQKSAEAARLRRLAGHYARKGDEMRRLKYDFMADAVERGHDDAAADEPSVLLAQGRYEDLLSGYMPDPEAFSAVSAALLRLGRLDDAEQYIASGPQSLEQRRKLATVDILRRLGEAQKRTPRVHAVMLAHNREHMVGRALELLAETDYPDLAVFVVDNGSTDKTAEAAQHALAKFPPHIPCEFVSLPINIGRPAGHNWLIKAFDHSEAEYIAIVDDDIVDMPRDWLGRLAALMELYPKAAVAGVKAVDPGLPRVIQGAGMDLLAFAPGRLALDKIENEADCGRQDYIGPVDHVIGCLNLYRKAALLGGAGLFDIRLSPCQMVDVEHHLRARRRGYTVLYHGLVEVEHHKSMGKGLLEDRYLFSNSMGNVVKLTHGVAPDAMNGLLEETARRRSGSATPGSSGPGAACPT